MNRFLIGGRHFAPDAGRVLHDAVSDYEPEADSDTFLSAQANEASQAARQLSQQANAAMITNHPEQRSPEWLQNYTVPPAGLYRGLAENHVATAKDHMRVAKHLHDMVHMVGPITGQILKSAAKQHVAAAQMHQTVDDVKQHRVEAGIDQPEEMTKAAVEASQRVRPRGLHGVLAREFDLLQHPTYPAKASLHRTHASALEGWASDSRWHHDERDRQALLHAAGLHRKAAEVHERSYPPEQRVKLARHLAFISPSTKEDSTVSDAMNDKLGRDLLKRESLVPGVDFWKDGAEASGMLTGDDESELIQRAAELGKRWRQKAVVAFLQDKKGPDRSHIIRTAEADPIALDKALTKAGVEFKTIQPHPYGSVIHVLDEGGKLEPSLRKWAGETGAKIKTSPGHVRFIGADDRDSAQHAFDEAIGNERSIKLARTNEKALRVAQAYNVARGLPFDPAPSTLEKSPELGRRVAKLYARLPDAPNHPKVKASYEALKRETLAQYEHLKNQGVKLEPWSHEGQPYANSAGMREDVDKNNHLFYFPTGSEMPVSHPLAEVAPNGLKYNDMFRAVHDYFGHAVHGHEFGPKGELRAWEQHARMFSPEARGALTMETHGQNSWVKYGPHAHQPAAARPYAQQKANVLPERLQPSRLARSPAVKSWLRKKIKLLISEGKTPKQAAGEAYGMVRSGWDKKHPLARKSAYRVDNTAAATQTAQSVNTDKRKVIVEQIIKEAGLSPAAVRSVLAHEPGKGVRSTVLTAIKQQLDPRMSKYVAAWIGMLGREKAVTVFHPHTSGKDRLHVFKSTLPPDQLGQFMQDSGIPKFYVEDTGGGSRGYVFSPGGQYDQHVQRVVGGTNASHATHTGTGFRIGSGEGTDADSRENYRNAIRSFESHATASTGPTS